MRRCPTNKAAAAKRDLQLSMQHTRDIKNNVEKEVCQEGA
jgi:hypothetical protein